jgi:hypothetical protein
VAEAAQAQQQQLQQARQQQEQELAALRTAAFDAHERHRQLLEEATRHADRRLDEQAAQLRGGHDAQFARLRQRQEDEARSQKVRGVRGTRWWCSARIGHQSTPVFVC